MYINHLCSMQIQVETELKKCKNKAVWFYSEHQVYLCKECFKKLLIRPNTLFYRGGKFVNLVI